VGKQKYNDKTFGNADSIEEQAIYKFFLFQKSIIQVHIKKILNLTFRPLHFFYINNFFTDETNNTTHTRSELYNIRRRISVIDG